MDNDELYKTGIKAFNTITRKLELSEQEKMLLLGIPSYASFINLDDGHIELNSISNELLDRLSYTLSICKNLSNMHSNENQKLFLRNPSEVEPFNGCSPLHYMLSENTESIKEVRRYLEHQRFCK